MNPQPNRGLAGPDRPPRLPGFGCRPSGRQARRQRPDRTRREVPRHPHRPVPHTGTVSRVSAFGHALVAPASWSIPQQPTMTAEPFTPLRRGRRIVATRQGLARNAMPRDCGLARPRPPLQTGRRLSFDPRVLMTPGQAARAMWPNRHSHQRDESAAQGNSRGKSTVRPPQAPSWRPSRDGSAPQACPVSRGGGCEGRPVRVRDPPTRVRL